ncbi:hypothetical protein [Thermomonas sp.]|uniref:hypothetical protein n=1 Tax=Thermomonas sp. TaxID=1971895 RepID=UPI00391B4C07
MPRTKTAETPPQATASPGGRTSPLFQARKPAERGGALTRERIAEHMDAFRKAGGTIEVLGTTRALQRIGLPADAVPEPPAPQGKGRPRKTPR